MQLQLLTDIPGSRLDHASNLHVIRKQLAARALVGLDVVDPLPKLLPLPELQVGLAKLRLQEVAKHGDVP